MVGWEKGRKGWEKGRKERDGGRRGMVEGGRKEGREKEEA